MLQFTDIKPEPVIVKKIVVEAAEAHHGGAWKVAYADFVTAMMAFFLLMWIIGATNEDQRKGIADYFRPTLAEQSKGGGANGLLKGRSLAARDGVANANASQLQSPSNPLGTIDRNNGSRTNPTGDRSADEKLFAMLENEIRKRVASDPGLDDLAGQIAFLETPEGLRIEMIDDADFSMFEVGTSRLGSRAAELIGAVSAVIRKAPNTIAIRGHTDARSYERRHGWNNWLLSAERADATRRVIEASGVARTRIGRIEGVADRELHVPSDPLDARNRRVSITLLYGSASS